jgi:imidazolonepropionase
LTATHLVWAGCWAREFELSVKGATYEEAVRTGGIGSSVTRLREASETDLLRQTLPRLDALIGEDVTPVGVESGLGLDLEHEHKSLRIARRLREEERETWNRSPPWRR